MSPNGYGTSGHGALLARPGAHRTRLRRARPPPVRALSGDLSRPAGAGSSQWAREPTREYRFAFFGQMALELCQQLGIGRMRWVGTSMGGMLGIVLAADTLRDRITHLVLNDVGPEIPPPPPGGSPPTWGTRRPWRR